MKRKSKYFIPPYTPPVGETLKEKLDEMGITEEDAATRLSEPTRLILDVLKGVTSITNEMAKSFEDLTGLPAQFWLNRQTK